MSQDLVAHAKNVGLVTLSDMDQYGGIAKEIGAEYNLGSFLQFSGKTGDYKAGDQPIDHGSALVVDILSGQRGWICWKDEKPVDRSLVPIFPPKPIPSQADLTDHGPYGKRPDGSPAGGWSEIIESVVTDPASGQTYKFGLSSKSGIRAMAKLIQEFFQKVKMYADEDGRPKLPVVEIGASSFKIAGVGTLYAPTFTIIDWMDRAEYEALSPSVPAQEEEGEEYVEEVEVVEETKPAPKAAPKKTVPQRAPVADRAGYKGGAVLKK